MSCKSFAIVGKGYFSPFDFTTWIKLPGLRMNAIRLERNLSDWNLCIGIRFFAEANKAESDKQKNRYCVNTCHD